MPVGAQNQIPVLRQELDTASTDASKLTTLIYLAEEYWYVQPDSSITLGKQAFNLAAKLDDSLNQGYACNAIGTAYLGKSEYSNALHYLHKGIQIAEELDSTDLRSTLYLNISNVYGDMEQYALALRYLQMALDLDLKSNYTLGLAYEYLGIAEILADEHQYLEALGFFRKGWEIARAENSTYLMHPLEMGMAQVLEKTGQFNLARQRYRSALKHVRTLGDRIGFAEGTLGLARVFQASGQPELALIYADSAKSTSALVKDPQLTAECHLTLARILLDQGKAAQAGKTLRELELAVTLDSLTSQLVNFWTAKRDVLLALNNQSDAWKVQNKLDTLERASWERRVHQGYQALELMNTHRENTRLKERQNVIREKNELQQVLIQRNALLLAALSAVLLVVLVFLIFMIRERSKQRRQNALLQEQKDELQELHQTKDRLFSVISHDLKEPINQMQGLLSLLKSNALNEEEKSQLLDGIARNTELTRQNLENLLHWARNQLHGEKISAEKLQLMDYVHRCVGQLTTPAHLKGLQWEIEDKDYAVIFDPNHLEVILRNLLSNAVKFAPQHSIISISVVATGAKVILIIRDQGLGIPGDLLHLIGRGPLPSGSGTFDEKGTGLGLALSYTYAAKNGTEIRHRNHPDGGAEVTVIIPRA